MALVVDVPLNTMLADLDETLRVLLKRELGRHGFDGVDVAFDAPARDWSSQLSGPTVNLFLYDLRESHEFRPTEWQPDRAERPPPRVRPPLIIECSYAVTAWTQAVEDEHRLLSQVLGVLFAFPQLPDDALAGRLAETGASAFPIEGKIGQAQVRRQGRLLVRRRRPVQGLARLRRHALLRVGHRLRARPGGADADARAADRATRRRRRSSRGTASAARCADADGRPLRRRLGRAAGRSGCWPPPTRTGRFRFDRVPRRRARAASRAPRDGREAKARSSCPASARPRRSAPAKRRREEGRLTEWAAPAARTAAPRPSGAAGARQRRCWVQCPATNSPAARAARQPRADGPPRHARVLAEGGVEVVGEEERAQALVLMRRALRPDAVVLDLRQVGVARARRARAPAAPEAKVILWARDEDEMEVLDPGATTPRRVLPAVPEELRSELSKSRREPSGGVSHAQRT